MFPVSITLTDCVTTLATTFRLSAFWSDVWLAEVVIPVRIQTGREFCWVTQHLQKQICSTQLCTIYCLNFFAKMLSGPQSYMESNSASNWYSFQWNLQCRIQSSVEFCWVTQHLQKQICSTLPCTIYCLNYFAKMLSGPQSYIKSNSASYWYSFQCNFQCRIQTGVEFCWVTQHL